MLYSRAAGVAFAHYPKTAGSSLQAWFRQAFPDAQLLVPDNPHLPVCTGLEMIGREPRETGPRPWRRGPAAPRIRWVVGVLREPFEMIVSLYEFWRHVPFAVEPTEPFIRCARFGSFTEFVRMAVIDGQLPTYEWFFDVGGPAWPQTRLLDFRSLDVGLADLAAELGLRHRPRLERHNAHAGPRDLVAYAATAGDLVGRVHDHFRWYYDHLTASPDRARVA